MLITIYLAVLAFGLHRMFGPTFESGFARIQTERGDGMLNHYILEHEWLSLTEPGYIGTLFSPPCFHPTRHTLWYSEHMFGTAPLYWLLRLVLPMDLAYQWWQILLNGLNFMAFAAVMRWLRCPHILAMLGGYLWTFSLIQIDQIKHQQMIPRFAMVLAVYHAWQFVKTLPAPPHDPLRHLNRLSAAVFFQGITCVYTGWFLTTGLLTFLPLAIHLTGSWRILLRFLRDHWGRVVLILLGWGGALALTYVPYVVVNWGIIRTYDECVVLMPTWEAWFAGVPGTPWETMCCSLRECHIAENWLFCGFVMYLVPTMALIHLARLGRRQRTPEECLMLAGLLTALLWVLFTIRFGEEDYSLWQVIRFFPGGTAIRAVSRVYVSVHLFGVLAAMLWLGRVTEQFRPPIRFLIRGLVTAAAVFEQLGYEPSSFEKPDFYAIADRTIPELRKGEIAYIVPRYTDSKGETLGFIYGDVMGMWCGLRANVPVVNGYSGRWPNQEYIDLLTATDEDQEAMLRKWLEGRYRGRVALVDPDKLSATRVIQIE
jgi:hypothetical protein